MSYLRHTSSKSKNFFVLPLCAAVTSVMMVGCGSTPTSTQNRAVRAIPQAPQPRPPATSRTNYPSQPSYSRQSDYPAQIGFPSPQDEPLAAHTPAITLPESVSLLDQEDLDELEDLLQATDMTMVEDNKLAIQQYGNLWNRLRAGYGLDQSQYSYNSRIEAQKNWFIPRQDYLNRLSARASRYLYHTVIEAERRNIPTELALLPVIESSYDPTATSNASAAGLWQFIPSTGRIYGLNQSPTYDGRRDVIESTRAAYDFLTTLYNQFGSWELALAAYNAGPGRIQRAIDYNESQGLPTDFWSLRLPKETMSYVPRFLAVAQIVQNPDKYGVYFPAIANRQHFRSVPASDGVSLYDVSRITGVDYDELRMLNPALTAGKVDVSGPKRVVIPNQVSSGLDNQITTLMNSGEYSAANNVNDYNYDPYQSGVLASSADGLADFANNAKVPRQTTDYIQPVRQSEPAISARELQDINSQLVKSNSLPTTSTSITPNATIVQEPPLSQAERDFIAAQIRQNAPQVQQVVSPADGNIKLDAVQTQQSILETQGAEKRLSFDAPLAHKPKPRGTRSVYVVKRGDTLSGIAERAGLSWQDIAEWNQIDPQANLLAGSSLYLYNARPMNAATPSRRSTNNSASSNSRSASATRYTVRSGDTLLGTANRFGLSASQLASYNGLTTNSQLRIGQVLSLVPNENRARQRNSASNTTASSAQNTQRARNSYTGATQTYRVRAGETLTGLARRHGVALSTIAGMNDLSIRAQLIAGQQIKVPAPKRSLTTNTQATRQTYSGATTNYTVKAGDSLYKIANSLNVSRADIASINNFDANAQLRRGQVIKVPATTVQSNSTTNNQPSTYRIQSGDTLIGVANRFEVSVSALADANNLPSNAQLIRGRTLKIPASGTTTATSTNANANANVSTISRTQSYTVKSGDTLIGLASEYGVSLASLAATNNIASNSQLRIGQKLQVPVTQSSRANRGGSINNTTSDASFSGSYKVQSGDTLIGLASKFGVPVSQLASANNMASNAQLQINQRLKVPSTTSSSSASVAATPNRSSSDTTRSNAPSNFDDTYTVTSGDTLTGVAGRYGISRSQLANANGLSASARLQLGQRLKVPALTMNYTVKSGDTMIGLANRFGVTRKQIADLNNITPSTQLRIGQKLVIPR